MKRWFFLLIATVSLMAASGAHASFHLFRIEQLYSNGDGSVQFIVLHECCGVDGENLWAGQKLTVTHAGNKTVFVFPKNLPGGDSGDYGMMASPTANSRVLVATQGFANLGIVTPDYVMPSGFLPMDGGTLNYAGVDSVTYTALPTDGTTAINRNGTAIPNLATNFAGASASVSPSSPVAQNYEGLWYAAPAGSESGWGINFAHQGDIIFATWFTYDLTGRAWWLVMPASKIADKVYHGALVETRGPAFNAQPFSPMAVTSNTVGSGTLSFSDANNGTFDYIVNGFPQTKSITREVWGKLPTCAWGKQPDLTLATKNYQDLWYAFPAESESGWGVNFTHQDDIIFATWFTYDFDGKPLWLYAVATKTAPGVYAGPLNRNTGPAFNAVPFLTANARSTEVGTLTIAFTNGNSASFAYEVTLNGPGSKVTQTKTVTREVWDPPGTVCE